MIDRPAVSLNTDSGEICLRAYLTHYGTHALGHVCVLAAHNFKATLLKQQCTLDKCRIEAVVGNTPTVLDLKNTATDLQYLDTS